MTDLAAQLRELVAYAERGGAADAWLSDTAGALVAVLLEHAEMRRSAGDRRARALVERLALRQFAEQQRADGQTAAAIRVATCARFGVSRRTYYRWRRQCHIGGTGTDGTTLTAPEVTKAFRSWR